MEKNKPPIHSHHFIKSKLMHDGRPEVRQMRAGDYWVLTTLLTRPITQPSIVMVFVALFQLSLNSILDRSPRSLQRGCMKIQLKKFSVNYPWDTYIYGDVEWSCSVVATPKLLQRLPIDCDSGKCVPALHKFRLNVWHRRKFFTVDGSLDRRWWLMRYRCSRSYCNSLYFIVATKQQVVGVALQNETEGVDHFHRRCFFYGTCSGSVHPRRIRARSCCGIEGLSWIIQGSSLRLFGNSIC